MISKELICNDNNKCIACNKCIRACPQYLSNKVVSIENELKIEVEQTNCVSCGECIKECSHDARYFKDDTDAFLNHLNNSKEISVIVAPIFMVNYPNEYKKISWLKRKGVKLIYDVSFGADITTYMYIKAIKERKLKSIIANPCPVIVNSIEKHYPKLIPYLSPIGSPMYFRRLYKRCFLQFRKCISCFRTNKCIYTRVSSYNRNNYRRS